MSKSSQLEYPIYTALTVPTVTSYPSLKCLQVSADGQVCFITKNSAFILTPDHGINFDNTSTIRSVPTSNKDKEDLAQVGLGVGWFKTMIQHEKATPMRWPEYSQAWGAVSLGSIDLSLISMAISPSGLGVNGGCVYATLSSNMDLNLWTAGKNYLKGEWMKICDVTPCLLNYVAPADEDKATVSSVLQAQTVCIEWTPQADFGSSPAPRLDGSLLVLGSRAGSLMFLRYQNGADPEHVGSLSVVDNWITQLAFSSWDLVKPGHCEGYLAYGVSDGSIGLVKITQMLKEDKRTFSFTPKYEIEVTLEHGSDLVHRKSNCSVGITSLRWIQVPGRSPILVFSNPGKINLWSAPSVSSQPYWSGTRTLLLQTQKTSLDSSAFHPVSGLTYVPKHDRLIITLFDGSFHAMRGFSVDPAWATRAVVGSGRGDERISSEALSGVSRAVFVKAEVKEGVDKLDMLRINGAVGYDGDGCFMWVYESARPSDFSYKHDAKHSSMLIVAQMWEDEDDELLLQNLAASLNNSKTASGVSTLQILRPFLFHLRNPTRLDLLHARFLAILQPPNHICTEDHSTRIVVPRWDDGPLDAETRRKFRDALSTHLFGWDELLSLRMSLSLGDFAWKLAISEQRRADCGVVAQELLNAISHRVLRTIVRHLVAVIKLLTANDIPFVSRMIVQSLLPGCPPDLSEEGRQLSVLIQPQIEGPSSALPPPRDVMMPSDEIMNKLNESCPACGVEVPLLDITTAVCVNGHTWARCSVTTFILSTPWVRTCVGCSRKAFLPPSVGKDLPKIAQGWVAEELLEAVHRCLFCNNAFVSIL